MRPFARCVGIAATFLVIASATAPRVAGHGLQLVAPAQAEDVMKFEPVPSESVAALERRAARLSRDAERRAAEAGRSTPDTPDAPDVPEPPEAPEPPEPPESNHAGDVVRIGSDIHIEKGQTVEGDVFALRGDIVVDGHVKGNVAATGGDVTLGPTARVDGDVMCIGGRLEEEDGARVLGQRVTALRSGSKRIDLAERLREHRRDWDWRPDHDARHLSFALSSLLISLLLAWGIGKFAPNRTLGAVASLRHEPGLSLGIGLGVILLLVPSVVALALVVAVLCITIIGIPLALGVILAYVGLLVVLGIWGYVVGVIPIGQRAVDRLKRPATPTQLAVFGVLVVSGLRVVSEIFQFLPFFGWFGKLLWVVAFLVGFVAAVMGAGALIRTKFGLGREARWWPLFGTQRPAPSTTAGPPPPPSVPPPPEPPPAPPVQPSPAA